MTELTRQHFEEIVRIIKNSVNNIETLTSTAGTGVYLDSEKRERVKEITNDILCNNFADWLSTTNPGFDRSKFMDACIVEGVNKLKW